LITDDEPVLIDGTCDIIRLMARSGPLKLTGVSASHTTAEVIERWQQLGSAH
jgi:hypothetical protein